MKFGHRLKKGIVRAGIVATAMSTICASVSAGASPDSSVVDDRWYVAPMFSYVIADGDRNSDNGYGAALALGKRVAPQLELELRGQYLNYKADDSRAALLGIPLGAAVDDVSITSGGGGVNIFPFESGRGLYLHGDAMGGDARLFNVGLGYDYAFGSRFALRLEALYHDDDDAGVQEPQFNVGVRVPIGAMPQPAEPHDPVSVVTPVAPVEPPPAQCADGRDNDGDGLVDYPADPGCDGSDDDDESNPRCAPPGPGQVVDLDGCAVGDSIVLHGVNFEFDKSTLTANAKALLDQVADALIKRGDITVEVAGHTDSLGSESYNRRLSDARARSVASYLASKGVDASRMKPVGYGESRPIADNRTDEGRELNRRVELEILSSAGPVSEAKTSPPVFEDKAAPEAEASPGPENQMAPDSATAPVSGSAASPVSSQEADPAAEAPDPMSMATTDPATPADAASSGDATDRPAGTAASAGASVTIADYAFGPETVVVASGGTVTWTNNDRTGHIVKFGDGESPKLKTGETYSRRFDEPGTYPYVCGIHASMHGVVIVR